MIPSTSHVPPDTSEPVLETTVGSVLRRAAELDPDRIGLVASGLDIDSHQRWSFGELLEASEGVARALLGRFDPGEHVAVWAPNLPEWNLLQFGMGLAGLVLVPLNPAYRQAELSYALRQSRAAGIFYVPEFRGSPMAEWVARAKVELPALRSAISLTEWDDFRASGSPPQRLPEVSPSDPVQIQYTSGTTGAPKGAVLHHRGLRRQQLRRRAGRGLPEPRTALSRSGLCRRCARIARVSRQARAAGDLRSRTRSRAV
jgi:fatty-acyl-CoA synthase